MNERDFVAFCRATVAEYANRELIRIDYKCTEEDVSVEQLEELGLCRRAVLYTKHNEVSRREYYVITLDEGTRIADVEIYERKYSCTVAV